VANPIRREQYDHEVKDSRVNEVFWYDDDR